MRVRLHQSHVVPGQLLLERRQAHIAAASETKLPGSGRHSAGCMIGVGFGWRGGDPRTHVPITISLATFDRKVCSAPPCRVVPVELV
jgi:hypothetical protein